MKLIMIDNVDNGYWNLKDATLLLLLQSSAYIIVHMSGLWSLGSAQKIGNKNLKNMKLEQILNWQKLKLSTIGNGDRTQEKNIQIKLVLKLRTIVLNH